MSLLFSCHESVVESYTRRKRERELAEQERLIRLVEQGYRYKNGTYDSAQNQFNKETTDNTTEKIRLEVTEGGEIRERARTIVGENLRHFIRVICKMCIKFESA